MKKRNYKRLLSLAIIIPVLLGASCRTRTIVYDPSTGQYTEGKEARKILDEREKVNAAQEASRDRDLDRNIKRRESSRYVTRESVIFGQSIDEFDVLAARERALQAENAESVSKAHKIIDYEKRYERAMDKLDRLEVLPGVRKK